MNRVATICVRKGSKGLPGKNLMEIDGFPLFAIAIRQARETGIFSEIVVSSDDPVVLSLAESYGATFVVQRPDKLASDQAGKPETIKHAVEVCEKSKDFCFSTVVDLDATSPLRNKNDIRGAVELLERKKVSSVITTTSSGRNPYFNMVKISKSGFVDLVNSPATPFLSRQSAPKTFDMNAAVHVWNRNALLLSPKVFYEDTMMFEMPQARSHDIDTEVDFKVVSFLFQLNKKYVEEEDNIA
jgi:CMP-N,N'-diacetyllegionaminic acid synthase